MKKYHRNINCDFRSQYVSVSLQKCKAQLQFMTWRYRYAQGRKQYNYTF